MAGKLIVIEGLDGSGKATQTKLVYEALRSRGSPVEKLTFPDYENPSSALVKLYLDGTLGNSPEDVNAYAASAFYAVDRVASYLQFWKETYTKGGILLCDRYATSNIIYQMSKLEHPRWDAFMHWLEDFEYNKLEIPKPDLVIYLDVPLHISQQLLLKRYEGNEGKKDLHEKNLAFLNNCRTSALYAAEKLGWSIIRCEAGDSIRPADHIFKEVFDLIQTEIGTI